MTVRVFNHSPYLVFTNRGKPIPSQTWAEVEPLDVHRLVKTQQVRIVADMDEKIPPLIAPQEAAALVEKGVDVNDLDADRFVIETPSNDVVPEPKPAVPFSQKEDGSSTIKPKRARTKRPPAAKE